MKIILRSLLGILIIFGALIALRTGFFLYDRIISAPKDPVFIGQTRQQIIDTYLSTPNLKKPYGYGSIAIVTVINGHSWRYFWKPEEIMKDEYVMAQNVWDIPWREQRSFLGVGQLVFFRLTFQDDVVIEQEKHTSSEI